MDKRKLLHILGIAAAAMLGISAAIQFFRSDFLSGVLMLLAALFVVGFLVYMRKAPTP